MNNESEYWHLTPVSSQSSSQQVVKVVHSRPLSLTHRLYNFFFPSKHKNKLPTLRFPRNSRLDQYVDTRLATLSFPVREVVKIVFRKAEFLDGIYSPFPSRIERRILTSSADDFTLTVAGYSRINTEYLNQMKHFVETSIPQYQFTASSDIQQGLLILSFHKISLPLSDTVFPLQPRTSIAVFSRPISEPSPGTAYPPPPNCTNQPGTTYPPLSDNTHPPLAHVAPP